VLPAIVSVIYGNSLLKWHNVWSLVAASREVSLGKRDLPDYYLIIAELCLSQPRIA